MSPKTEEILHQVQRVNIAWAFAGATHASPRLPGAGTGACPYLGLWDRVAPLRRNESRRLPVARQNGPCRLQ